MGVALSFISLKGGVGKTTLSAALAYELANNYDKKVLLVDGNYSAPNLGIHLDIITPRVSVQEVLRSGNISSAVDEKHGVDIVPGNFLYGREYDPLKLRTKLQQAKKTYDFIIIDSSPALNEEFLSSLLAADSVFLVATPDYPALSCSMKAARIARQRGKPISGMIVNRFSDKRYNISLEEIQESTGVPVVAMLHEDSSVGKSLYDRTPIGAYDKNSSFAKEVRKLAGSLVGHPEKVSWIRKNFGKLKKQELNRASLKNNFYTSIFKD